MQVVEDCREPEISEAVGGLEVFADGAVVRLGFEVATVICYRDGPDHPEVLRLYMPMSGFIRSLFGAVRNLNCWGTRARHH